MICDGKTVMITGGTGSFGYQMTSKLLEKDVKIKIYSRDEDKHREMKHHFNDDKISFVLGDLRDYDRLDESLKNVDIVLHAGALKQIPSVEFNPMEALKTNTLSAHSIMKASDRNNVEQVIAISTDKACKPVNSYGMTKALMEKIITGDDISSNAKFGCVRYGNVIGSRGSVLPVWDKQIAENEPISVTSTKMRRFFLTLSQATDLIMFTSEHMDANEIFVSHAPAIYIHELASVYSELKTGRSDYPIKEIGIRAGEKIDEILISEEEMTHTDELDDGKYFRINRQDKYHHDVSKQEYSSSTTDILSKDAVKSLIENLTWVK